MKSDIQSSLVICHHYAETVTNDAVFSATF